MNVEIVKNADGTVMTAYVEGSVDTVTAPTLQEKLSNEWKGVTELTLDFEKVDYVSSAGLRVIMVTDRQMSDNGKLILKNVNEDVREVLSITGLDELLNIE